jgi:uncharacterized glyoxalase superfamily protein PhnB
MAKNPPEGSPRLSPLLTYNDIPAALDWLAEAFGFERRMAMPGPDGSIMHAEMTIADAVVMLGPASEEEARKSPADLGAVSQSLYVFVDDVDAHCATARAAGAKIRSGPEDQFWGDRSYSVHDPEGHLWIFPTHVRDVALEDMQPPGA